MKFASALALGYAGGLLCMAQPGPADEPKPLCQQQTVEEEASLYREIIDQQRKDIDELYSISGKYHRLVGLWRARVKANHVETEGLYSEITRLCAEIEAHRGSADSNRDGRVDVQDWLALLAQWSGPGPAPADQP